MRQTAYNLASNHLDEQTDPDAISAQRPRLLADEASAPAEDEESDAMFAAAGPWLACDQFAWIRRLLARGLRLRD